MIFSLRYYLAIRDKKLVVTIPDALRPKLQGCLTKHNSPMWVQPDPNDNWRNRSSVIEEALGSLFNEHSAAIPGIPSSADASFDTFGALIRHSPAPYVFDFIESALPMMDEADREPCRKKLNDLFGVFESPWRIVDGQFFKLDNDFLGASLTVNSHESLTAHGFSGASDEFAKARQELAGGDFKDSILHAGKSLESMMKVLTSGGQLNANQLTSALVDQGYLDDLPQDVRKGIASHVLMAVPMLRNKLAGHGQGASIVEVPRIYAELVLQLSAAFHNFFVAKYLERNPPVEAKAPEESRSLPMADLRDEIPF